MRVSGLRSQTSGLLNISLQTRPRENSSFTFGRGAFHSPSHIPDVLDLPISKNAARLARPDGKCGSFPESKSRGLRRRNRPDGRQQFRKRLPEPQGQRSFRPSFSASSLSPWTMRTPRFTRDSDGNPLRRLLIGSKKMADHRGRRWTWHTVLSENGRERRHAGGNKVRVRQG